MKDSCQIVRVFFRYDDITGMTPIDIEKNLKTIFAEVGNSCSVGVVPYVTRGNFRETAPVDKAPLSRSKIAFLQEAFEQGIFDILLHGYHHQTHENASAYSEFEGLAYDEQLHRIQQGKATLENVLGCEIRGFIPPWNTYDTKTILALTDSGFQVVSANRYGRTAPDDPLCYIPITIDFHEVQEAVSLARVSGDSQVIVGVLIHPYDFSASGDKRSSITYDALRDILLWLNKQDDVQVVTISALLQDKTLDVTSRRYDANKPWKFDSIFPKFLGYLRDYPIYLSEKRARRKKRKIAVLGTLLFAVICCASGLTTLLLLWYLPDIYRNITFIISIIFLCALVTKWYVQKTVFFRAVAVFSALSGIIFGIALLE